MKKTYFFKAIMMMCLMLAGATVFTACGEEDDLSTDQFAGGPVKLLAYGPNPVARMGELRILGVGLDKVQSVTIPGAGDITDINHISSEEIRLTVPNSAVIGKIVLHSASGAIESITALKYTEPVGFDDNCFSAPELRPGETLTIKGEYLNLVQSVIFANGVEVDQISNTRNEIKVKVPYEAQTGRVAISFCATEDTIPNQIFSPVEFKVTLPAVDEVANLTGKKPGDLMSHKGSNLDLVTRLTIAGKEIEEWWWYDDDKSTIGYNLPESTPDAAVVSIWPASGVECVIAYIGMQLPTELKATPNTGIKAGDKMVITGKDLDVVECAYFPGVADAVTPSAKTPTSITLTVPEGAYSGNVVLNCLSGLTTSIAYETLKPSFTEYNPSPVAANNELIIKGKDLDLVAKVQFSGIDPVEVSASAAQISVKVPTKAESGVVTAIMKNGEMVEFPALTINKPECAYIVDETPLTSTDDNPVKAGDLVAFEIENADRLTGIRIDGADCQYILKGKQVYVLTPTEAGSKSQLTLISDNGEITYALSVIPNGEIVTSIWSGASVLGWSADGQIYLGDDGGQSLIAAGAKAGDILRIKLQPTADDWQVQIWEGHWDTMYDEIKADNYDLAGNKYYYNIVLTDALLATFTTQKWWGGIVLTQGQSCIVTGLELYQKISLETTVWEGNAVADDWGGQPSFFADGAADLLEAGMEVGSILRFYIKPMEDSWNLQVYDGHWNGQYNDLNQGNYDLAEHNGAVELEITQEIFDKATTVGGWGNAFLLNGDNVVCTKITLE